MILNPWLRNSPLTHADKKAEKGCDPGINSFLLMQPFVQLPLSRQPFYDCFSLPADSRNHHPVGFCLKKSFYSNLPHVHTRQFRSLSHSNVRTFTARLTKAIFYGHSTRNKSLLAQDSNPRPWVFLPTTSNHYPGSPFAVASKPLWRDPKLNRGLYIQLEYVCTALRTALRYQGPVASN